MWSTRFMSLGICLGIVSFGFAETAEQSKITWQASYAQAHAERIKHKRPMLVFVSMDGCRYCTKMLTSTYSNAQVVEDVTNTYIPTYVNASKDSNVAVAKGFKVKIFPTTFVVAPDNRILDRIEGYVDSNQFRSRLIKAQAQYDVARRNQLPAQSQ